MKLTTDATKAIRAITAAGGRPLIVGGCVRDWILGIPSKDIDIEVHGYVKPDDIRTALEAVGRVDAVGISFGVLKFGKDVDVSFPRRDSKTGVGHTGFTIEVDPSMSIEEAMSRRDFTINAIGYDPVTHLLVDPFRGRDDLEARRLKATSAAFADDPLRVLRGVQFAARFGFTIDAKTVTMCRDLTDRFTELSIERVWMEWWKILTKGKSMEAAAEVLYATEWDWHFPEWNYGNAVEADRRLTVVDRFDISPERRAAIVLTMMFIDRLEEAEFFMKRIDAPKSLRQRTRKMIETQLERGLDRPAGVRVVARSLGRIQLMDWLLAYGYKPGEDVWAAASRQGLLESIRKPLITGDDLIERGWTPGPEFKSLLATTTSREDRLGWDLEQLNKYLDGLTPQ